MKKVIGSLIAIIIAGAMIIDGYFLFIKDRLTNQQTTSSQTTSSQSTTSNLNSASSSRTQSAGTYKSGVYTGQATATKWGAVQVQATIKNGKLTTVKVLSYPNDNDHDKQVNARALPIYKSEAVKKQSANIQLVSGASETYKGFTGSLQDALNKAAM
ncbi:FMN-binding protein [Furfurilactobacillus sp. WILCCON 0119]